VNARPLDAQYAASFCKGLLRLSVFATLALTVARWVLA
jgi:hypothetical protein